MATSRQLLLLRHGKASWQQSGTDFQRPLTANGERQSRYIADWLTQASITPDCWLVSPALRTLMTADIIRLRLDQQQTTQNLINTLYLADKSELLKTLTAVPDSAQRVVLVGHNPGLSDLLIDLAAARLATFAPPPNIMWPATLAVLTFSGSWSQIPDRTLNLQHLIHGKQLAKSE